MIIYVLVSDAGYDGEYIDNEIPAFLSRQRAEEEIPKLSIFPDRKWVIKELKLIEK